MKAKRKDSCKKLFSKLGILTLYSQYIYSTLMFVVKYKDLLALNMEFHSINACHKLDLHVPLVNLFKVQKGVYYSDHATSLYPRKLALNFVDKWQSLNRYSSLAD
jgi:hypothetical protein